MENSNNSGSINDHLKHFVEKNDFESKSNQQTTVNSNVQEWGSNRREKVAEIVADSNYISIEMHELPFGKFYAPGTRIQVRPLLTVELESFAVINEKNLYDVKLKFNEILKACCKVTVNGKPGSYRDILDGDRDTIIIVLSRISKKHGPKLEKSTKDPVTGDEVKIELVPANYVYKEENPKLTKWFDKNLRKYSFKLKNETSIDLAPPTVGISEDIDRYILEKAAKSGGKETPNITFMRCIPYILSGRNVTFSDPSKLEQEEFNFSKMNDELFMFVEDAVKMIEFGIDELKTVSPYSGQEVRVPFGFPNGPRALFIVPNAFDEFIG